MARASGPRTAGNNSTNVTVTAMPAGTETTIGSQPATQAASTTAVAR